MVESMEKLNKKEDALKHFIDVTMQSWTFEKLTKEEQERIISVLNSNNTAKALKGGYFQRLETLHAIYHSFLMALSYEPIGWREDEEILPF